MGNDISQGSYQELDGLKKFAGFSPGQVEMIREKFDIMADEDLTISKEAFRKLMKVNEAETNKIFDCFDMDQTNRIDSYEFICGLALLSQSTLKQKAELIFNLYDFDKNKTITQNELVILIKTTTTALNAMASKPEATIQDAESKQKDILEKYDTNKDGTISLKEFQSFISKDVDILKMLYSYGLISKEDLRPDFGTGQDEMPDCDSDLENEVNKAEIERDERQERIKNGIEHTQTAEEDSDQEKAFQQQEDLLEDEQEEISQPWKKTIKQLSPSDLKSQENEAHPPTANLSIHYIHGYRSFDTRNNLKYSPNGELIYHTAAVGVSLDPASSSEGENQKYFLEHNDDIVCLDVFDNKAVTGQLGVNPLICVWDTQDQNTLVILKGVLKNGIGNVTFSNDGKKIAACSLDDERSIAIYDIETAIAKGKTISKKFGNEDGLLATGKITREPIFDIKFEQNDKTVIIGCKKEIYFATFDQGILRLQRGIWEKNNVPQATLCIGTVETTTVTGMFSGQLLIWNKNKLKQSVIAHQGPVTAMHTRKGQQKGLITAGRDGVILFWDHSIKQIPTMKIDVKEFRFWSNRIVALSEYIGSNGAIKLAIGSRSGEIAERVNEKPKVLVKGHFDGELWGLAVHAKNNQFFTVGEDNLLACWDIKRKMQLLSVKLDFPAKAMHMSPNGKYLIVGCTNGSVLIVDPKSLVVTFTFKDRDKEVSCIKFSPNSDKLAVAYGYPSCEILIYNVRNHFKNELKLRGSTSRVTHMDYSEDGKILMCNNARFELLFFDLDQGRLTNKYENLKDIKWSTYTCIFGWQSQGIWPPCSEGLDINSCDRTGSNSSDGGDVLVTGDDFSKIKLFKFPCFKENSPFVQYTGHSAQVTNVRFSADNQYIISTGGQEKSIIVWKYNFDREAANELEQLSQQVQIENVQQEIQDEDDEHLDNTSSTKPYHGQVTNSAPSWYQPNPVQENQVPDFNLQLNYVHGFKSSFNQREECRGMSRYLSNGKTVFAAAALGVVQDPKFKGQQTFFQKHKEDIVSMAVHPRGNIVATGQMALAKQQKVVDIYIWDAESKQVLGYINDFHRKAVVWLEFSPDGNMLLTAGQDPDNSIAIYEWQYSRLLATSKVDTQKVNGSSWQDNKNFVTVGNRHVKFWNINGRNLQCKIGTFLNKNSFEPQTCVLYNQSVCISGGAQGNLFVWNEKFQAQPGIQAHQGKAVGALVNGKNGNFISAGYDGRVIVWSLQQNQLEIKQEPDAIDINKLVSFDSSIVSLDIRNDTYLIGTKGSEVIEVRQNKQDSKAEIIQQGHYNGELWGLAIAPSRNIFVTCGGDKVVRKWDIETHQQIQTSSIFENDIRAIDWSKDGSFIVVADVKGILYLLNAENLKQLSQIETKFNRKKNEKKPNQWIEDLKISPDSTKVAFGAHNVPSTVEIIEISEQAGKKQFTKDKNLQLSGLSSSLTHLDWSEDSQFLVLNSSNYELKYVSLQAKGKDVSASACRDINWNTWTCIYGWYTQGIFPKIDGLEVKSCVRNNDRHKSEPFYKVLGTGDIYGRVNLYKYPAVQNKQVFKSYLGHSSPITKMRFSYDDKYLITIGGQDKSILIWETDLQQKQEVDDYQEHDEIEDLENNQIEELSEKPKKKGAEKFKLQNKRGFKIGNQTNNTQENDDYFGEEAVDQGDEFMAVKPWLAAIKEPKSYYKDPLNQNKKPPCSLNLDFVFGYKSDKVRNNIKYLKNGGIVYHAASLGIILSVDGNQSQQKFFSEHTDEITALDLHPDRVKVATGQMGKNATIFVWDTNTLHSICCFDKVLSRGVSSLAFSPSGDKLAAVAIDNYHEIAIFDITARSQNGGVLVTKAKSGGEFVQDLKWRNENEFASAGTKHFKVWTLNNTNLNARRGIWGKHKCSNILLTVASLGEDYIAGAIDGNLLCFKQNSLHKIQKATDTAVESLISCNGYLLVGGRDSKVIIYDKGLNQLVKISIDDLFKDSFSSQIKSLHLSADNKNLVIGTSGSEIYQLTTKDIKIQNSTKFSNPQKLMTGHYAPNRQTENELWGLTTHINEPDFLATVGDDGTLRTWSIKYKKVIKQTKINQDEKGHELQKDYRTNDLQDAAKGRAVAVSNDGETIVVGFKDGSVKIYDKDLNFKSYHKFAKEAISDIKFSPNGDLIAFGSHDNAIYLYSHPEMKAKCKPLRKHSSYITHLDFSVSGKYLHSNCGAYELLYWDVGNEKTGKQITNGATELRDEKWNTLTTPLSWGTQGIWPKYSDGSDINTVSRSNSTYSKQDGPPDNYHLLASGDDNSQVKVFRYPCIKKESQYLLGKGHASHVTQVQWSNEDQYLFTTGGGDNCLFIWNVRKNK
ncbi:WD40-repeat-containing domain [Pseudocohnilembus persalinus]|uniref:WD40-repeat-containing domain n=1 Tax=Pseudocohnilembus persalinus TaxID=266149 RepID=A0A0V0QUE2_PSEPJ|nr:WD40-repeat-containing domain [Pseudocohnilembus persalinus]|eukprot:KRX05725.1 WD40-repeat-containing domain [Pseudocohnilembus persalinus]